MTLTRSRILIVTSLLAFLLLSYGSIAAQDGDDELAGAQIYFSESSNEASIFDRSEEGLSRVAGLLQQLGAELFTLDWRFDIPAAADLVVIAGPTRDLSPEQMARLWVYLVGGGRLLLIAEPLVVSTSQGVTTIEANRALQATRGFFELTWADFGIRGRDDVLIHEDEVSTSGEITPEDLLTDFVSTVDEASVIQAEADDTLAFFGARSIEFDASIQPYRVTPLVYADPAFYGETAYADFVETGILEFNVGADLRGPELAVAVAVELETIDARIILIGDRQFVTNGNGLQTSPPNSPNFVYPGNVRFTLNSIGWLLGNESGLAIPLTFSTPAPTATDAPVIPTNTPVPTESLEPEATAEPETTAEPEATENATTGS